MKIPKHITDLTRDDFAEIARAANLDATDGIVLEERNGRYVLSIDGDWLRRFILDNS